MNGVAGKENFHARKCDIAQESEVLETFKWIESTFKTVHLLINNAAKYSYGSIIGKILKRIFTKRKIILK